jgi:hypothetical protein
MQTQKTIDLGDLVSALVSLRQPSRDLDGLIHSMLAGRSPRTSATLGDLRRSSWLAETTPEYTAGGPEVHVLATRLGSTLDIEEIAGGYRAFARSPSTGRMGNAAAPTEGAAACAALAALVGWGS